MIQCPRCGGTTPHRKRYCLSCGLTFSKRIKRMCAVEGETQTQGHWSGNKWKVAFVATLGVFFCFSVVTAYQLERMNSQLLSVNGPGDQDLVEIGDPDVPLAQTASVELESREPREDDEAHDEDGEWESSAEEEIFTGDFRNARWGMTPEQVLFIETAEYLGSGDTSQAYRGELAAAPVSIVYEFEDGRLVQGSYIFEFEHTSKNLYVLDFENLTEAYTEQYGEPVSEDVVWFRELYRDEPDHLGFAISLGDVAFATTWETEDTRIMLGLTGDNYEISVMAIYSQMEYSGNGRSYEGI